MPTSVDSAETSFQPVADRHEFIDLGYDAALFGERWEREGRNFSIFSAQSRHLRTLTKPCNIVDEVGPP